jgi:hypothetical protein
LFVAGEHGQARQQSNIIITPPELREPVVGGVEGIWRIRNLKTQRIDRNLFYWIRLVGTMITSLSPEIANSPDDFQQRCFAGY